MDEGLSGHIITCIYEDSDGFIWVGTTMGMNRYDGHRFEPYTNEKVSFVLEDKNKQIWLSPINYSGNNLSDEIQIVDPYTKEKKRIKDLAGSEVFLDKRILDFRQDETYNLWFSTMGGEIIKYDGNKLHLVYKNKNKSRIRYVMPVSENELIFKEDKFLVRWTKEKGIIEKHKLPNELLNSLDGRMWYDQGKDRVWMTNMVVSGGFYEKTSTSEVNILTYLYYKDKGEQFQELKLEDGVNKEKTGVVYGEMSDGQIWFFLKDRIHRYDTSGKLLTKFIFKDKDQKNITFTFSDNSQYGSKVVLGKDKTLWLTTPTGIVKFADKSSSFKRLLHQSGGKTLSTRGMVELDANHILMCTYDLGILKVNTKNDSYESVLVNNLLAFGMGMTKDRNGAIWIGSHSNKIYKYSPNKKSKKGYTIKSFSFDFNTQFQLPYYDSFNGQLWFGTAMGGLFYFDYEKEKVIPFTKWNGYEELKDLRIYSFFQNDKTLWIGTDEGVYLVDQEKGVLDWYKDFPIKAIKGMHQTNDGNIWLAGNEGLVRWSPDTNEKQLFSQKNGFPNDYLYAVYPDEFGFFWLPSNKGLIRFNSTNFEINCFLPAAGISHEEFNMFSQYKDSKGHFYFGGLNGVTVLDPADFLDTQAERPEIKLTDLNYVKNDSEKTINALPEYQNVNRIDWLPSMKSFQLAFALQDYSLADKQNYAYMIEGLDEDWIYIKENYLRFNQLPYGNYNLKIKGIGGKGIWSAPMNVALNVVIPFYKTWWFLTLFVLALAALIYRIFRWRVSALEKEVARRTQQIENDRQLIQTQYEELELLNKAKDRFYTIIAHDLRDPVISFRGIAAKINYLVQRNEPKRVFQLAEYVEESADNLSKLLENLLSWAEQQRGELLFRPSKHKFDSLVKEVFQLLNLFASTKKVKLRYIGNAEAIIFGDFQMLATILRNLVHNAIKFSHPDGTVIVDCQLVDEYTVFTVSDFGVGIESKVLSQLFKIKTAPTELGTLGEKGTGLGLVLCNDLVQKHKGGITGHSEKNKETVFTVKIPLDPNIDS